MKTIIDLAIACAVTTWDQRTIDDDGYDEIMAALSDHDRGDGCLGIIVRQARADEPACSVDSVRAIVLEAEADAAADAEMSPEEYEGRILDSEAAERIADERRQLDDEDRAFSNDFCEAIARLAGNSTIA
jgi:hypothetical protein